MKKKRRVLSFFLSLALFAGLAWPMPVSAATLYFTAVNDSVAPLTSDTMPFWSGGTLYVPYSVFDGNLNGIGVGLGLYTSYNRVAGTVTLFNLRQVLVFDLNSGTCRDDVTGAVYTSRAILRNGRPYLALNTVCSVFNLQYSYSQLPNIPQGYLVRVKNAGAVMSDADFIERARDLLNSRLREYTQSLNAAESTTPSPSAPAPAAPAAPQTPAESDTAVYMAFRCESAGGAPGILDALDGQGVRAVFFLSPQAIEEEGNLVRRILGAGHSIGVLADGEEGAEAALARGSRALEEAARTRTTLAYAPASQREALEKEGWVCWKETLYLSPGGAGGTAFANSVLSRLGNRRQAVCLTLEGGDDTARVLSALLRQLSGGGYAVAVPVETRL